MKKVILVPDSFKGTMSSFEICSIMKRAIGEFYPDCNVISIPVADGGEGTVEAYYSSLGGKMFYKSVTGPFLGEKTEGYYCILPDNTAVIEIASCASLPLAGERKNPAITTTFGVGELILDAVNNGAKKIVIGLGGSATNDASLGLASALGVSFLDKSGKSFIPTGGTLSLVDDIDFSSLDKRIREIPIVAMCDVDNTFYGENGASYIYGPQKGADKETVLELDSNMRSIAKLLYEKTGVDVQSIPGSGAAGGVGGGLCALFGAELKMGIDTLLDTVKFDELLENADFVYTGEGRIDGQSLRGKVVVGVSRRAKKKGVKVVAFVGDIGDEIDNVYNEGVSGIFSINRIAVPYKEARLRAKDDLYLTLKNLLRFQSSL